MELDREQQEIAQTAARLIVEDGLDYATARRKAMQEHGGGRRLRETPSNEAIEDEVRAHIAIFHADTQPAELRALRAAALRWMLRLAEFRPHLGGAVWRGTATRQSIVRIDLYCEDTKAPELALLNKGVDYETVSEPLGRGEQSLTLVIAERSAAVSPRQVWPRASGLSAPRRSSRSSTLKCSVTQSPSSALRSAITSVSDCSPRPSGSLTVS